METLYVLIRVQSDREPHVEFFSISEDEVLDFANTYYSAPDCQKVTDPCSIWMTEDRDLMKIEALCFS